MLGSRVFAAVAAAAIVSVQPLAAQDLIVEKQVFELGTYTTEGGATIKDLRIGWEAYGEPNEARDNIILVTHYFSGNSHAAGKYSAEDARPGYWDSIIGPGKAVDTNKF